MKKNKQHKSAFTLPEVLVAMSVMVLVVFASTNLVISVMRSNRENIDTLIAYGLAQEGVEAVRNIRDSNWLLGADFKGVVVKSGGGTKIWGEALPSLDGDIKYFTVDLNVLEPPANSLINSAGGLAAFVPWRLTDITEINKGEDYYGLLELTHIFRVTDPVYNEVHYGHFGVGADPTPFHRFIVVSPVITDSEPNKFIKMKVSSVVSWKEFGRPKEVRLETELTDWKREA